MEMKMIIKKRRGEVLKEKEGHITKQACKVISSRTLLFKFETYLCTTLNATDMHAVCLVDFMDFLMVSRNSLVTGTLIIIIMSMQN